MIEIRSLPASQRRQQSVEDWFERRGNGCQRGGEIRVGIRELQMNARGDRRPDLPACQGVGQRNLQFVECHASIPASNPV